MGFSSRIRGIVVGAILTTAGIAAAQPVSPVPGSPFGVINDSQTTLLSPDGRLLFTSGPTNRLRVINVSGATPATVGDFNTSCSITYGLARNPEGTRLYTVGFGSAFVAVHSIAPSGALTQMETEPLSISSVGNSVRYVRTAEGDFVFVNENRNGANFVSRYAVEADGKLGPAQRFATGANSTGSGYHSSPRIVGNDAKGLLFVLNGSSVSVMRLGPAGVPNTVGIHPLPAGNASSGAIATDRDGTKVFVGLTNGRAAVWNVGADGLLSSAGTIPTGCAGSIDGMQVHPSGRILVSVDVVRLGVTDLATGQSLLTQNVSNCTGVEIDRLGKKLYIGTSNGRLHVFNFNGYALQQPPGASADSYVTDEDQALNVPAPGVLANDVDPDGDALTAELVSSPQNGTLALNADGSFNYIPNPNYFGDDTFTYRSKDAEGASAPVTVAVTVRSVNDLPSANAGADQKVEATAPLTEVTVTGSGADLEGDVSYRWFFGSKHLGDGATLTTSLAPGNYTLTLKVTDGDGAVATDDVAITVADKTAPVLTGVPSDMMVAARGPQGAPATFTLPTAYDAFDGPVAVSVSVESGSMFKLGTTTVTVRAVDSSGNEATASFKVAVRYEWSGLLVGDTSKAKAGGSVMLKFRLVGGSAGVKDATAVLIPSAGVGEAFRYRRKKDLYVAKWSTKKLKGGTYTLKVDLGDGVERTATVKLK